MDLQLLSPAQTPLPPQWAPLLAKTGLTPESPAEITALLWDGHTLAATGSRTGGLIQYLAVDPAYQGLDLTATVLTALRRDAFAAGHRRLFLYTKPRNRLMLGQLFFYPVAQTADVLLMEDERNGLHQFLSCLPRPETEGPIGALVMNCDPFTLGHRHLVDQAAAQCGAVYVFVLSEDRGRFPAAHRLELVRRGTADLPHVLVQPSGPYMVSAATFPTYFLPHRDRAHTARCGIDIEIFGRHIAPALGITRRYVGTEPLSALTAQYNAALAAGLPPLGVELVEVPRLEKEGQPISASRVRALLEQGQLEAVRPLVPPTTFDYLKEVSRHVQ